MQMMIDPDQDSVYFHVVETPISRDRLVSQLYDHPAPDLVTYFLTLNAHLTRDPVPAGTLVVVVPASSRSCIKA